MDTAPYDASRLPAAANNPAYRAASVMRARVRIRNARLVWFATVIGLGSVSLSCEDDFKLPSPPDMSALVQAYDHPTGTVDAPKLRAVATAVGAIRNTLASDAPIELVRDLVARLVRSGGGDAGQVSDEADGGAADTSPDASTTDITFDAGTAPTSNPGQQTILGRKFDVAAIVQLHRACRDQPNDETSGVGSVDMTAVVDKDGVNPTVWGEVTRCRRARDRLGAQLDGALRIHFGTNQARVGLLNLRELGYLVEFEGTVIVDVLNQSGQTNLHLDFRVLGNEQIQFNITQDDGTNVVAVVEPRQLSPGSEDSMLTVGLMTRDTNWRCEISAKGTDGLCTDALDATKMVSW